MADIDFSKIEVFDGKSLESLLKQIHDNSDKKGKKIEKLIDQLAKFISGPEDATLLVPLLAEYLDVAVRNDDQLIKLATVVQRYLSTLSRGESDGSNTMPLDEIQELIQNRKESGKIIKMGNG